MAKNYYEYVIQDSFSAPGTAVWNVAMSISDNYLNPNMTVTGGVRYLPACERPDIKPFWGTTMYNMVVGDTIHVTVPASMNIERIVFFYRDKDGMTSDVLKTVEVNGVSRSITLTQAFLAPFLNVTYGDHIIISFVMTTTVETFNSATGVKTTTVYSSRQHMDVRMFYNTGSIFRTTIRYTSPVAAKLQKATSGDYTVTVERSNLTAPNAFTVQSGLSPKYSRSIDLENATITHTLTYNHLDFHDDYLIQYPTTDLVHNDTADYVEYYAPKIRLDAGMVAQQGSTEFVERGAYVGVCVTLVAHKHVGFSPNTTVAVSYADQDSPNTYIDLGNIETANAEVSEDYWFYFPSDLTMDKNYNVVAKLTDTITTQNTIAVVLCYKPLMSLRYEKGIAFFQSSTQPNALEIGTDTYFHNIDGFALCIVGMLVEEHGVKLICQNKDYYTYYVLEIATETDTINTQADCMTQGIYGMHLADSGIAISFGKDDSSIHEDDGLTCILPSSEDKFLNESSMRKWGICTQAGEFVFHGTQDQLVDPDFRFVKRETTRFHMYEFEYRDYNKMGYIGNPYCSPNAKNGYTTASYFYNMAYYPADTSYITGQKSNRVPIETTDMIINDEGYSAVTDITLSVS